MVIPLLRMDGSAEEAMSFYVSAFENSRVLSVTRCEEGGAGSQKATTSASFQLDGQRFQALDGGAESGFSAAPSFLVTCHTQRAIDELWEKLSKGGERQRCGWLRDRYGLAWRIVPAVLSKMLNCQRGEKAARVTEAMLQMEKLEISRLRRAYRGCVVG